MPVSELELRGDSGLRCPACHVRAGNTVVDSRANDDGSWVRRRRECLACQARFTTYELGVDLREKLDLFDAQHTRANEIAAELREMARCLEVW